MKKLFSIILTVCLIVAMTSVSFGHEFGGSYIAEGTASSNTVKAGDTFTYSICIYDEAAPDDAMVVNTDGAENVVNLKYDHTAFELVDNPTVGYGAELDTKNIVTADGSITIAFAGTTAQTSYLKSTPIVTYTFNVLETATAGEKTFASTSIQISDAEDFTTLETGYGLTTQFAPVTVKGDDPDPVTNVTPDKNASAEVTFGENKYTGLYTYSLETNVTKFNLVATYNEGLTKNLKYAGSEAIELNNIDLKDGEGTITFKIAIIGVPADVTISGLAIQAIQ